MVAGSVVDPDPELVAGSRLGSGINHFGSGYGQSGSGSAPVQTNIQTNNINWVKGGARHKYCVNGEIILKNRKGSGSGIGSETL